MNAEKCTPVYEQNSDSLRKRGRPRIYEPGETATERVNRSLRNLVHSGGARRTFRLSPEANEALKLLRIDTGKTNDTAVIDEMLIKMAKKLKLAKV
jgi:hypothetical protein